MEKSRYTIELIEKEIKRLNLNKTSILERASDISMLTVANQIRHSNLMLDVENINSAISDLKKNLEKIK